MDNYALRLSVGLQTECAETEGCIPCKDNTCLANYQMCDSVFNCPDGSDEMGCEEKVSGCGIRGREN